MILDALPKIAGIIKIEMTEPKETGGIAHEPMNWRRELKVKHRLHGCGESDELMTLYGPTRESLLLPCEIVVDAALRRVATDAVVPGACE